MCTEKQRAIDNLVIASLISEGNLPFTLTNEATSTLKVPYSRDKSFYLLSYLESYNLSDFVSVKPHKEQFTISLNEHSKQIVNHWVVDNEKIFTKTSGINHVNFKSLIIAICLFGTRKLEGIDIPTSVDKRYIKTLSYSLNRKLEVDIIPGAGSLKIYDVTNLFLSVMADIPSIESTQIANLLTNQEKSRLLEAAIRKGEEQYV